MRGHTIGSTYGSKDEEFGVISSLVTNAKSEEDALSIMQAFGVDGTLTKGKDGKFKLGILTKVADVAADSFITASAALLEQEKNLKNTIEKYEVINYLLEENTRLQEKAEQAAEKAVGKEKLDLMEEKLALMEEEDRLL
jgi:hypothetical protein